LGASSRILSQSIEKIMNSKRILYADDEMAIRLLIGEELKEEGYDVITVSDGKEVLEMMFGENINIDLVILDIKMEYINGIETLRRIKERYPDLPVILYTAYSEYKKDSADASDEYIVKSTDLLDLMLAIKRHCPPSIE
jgi:CheY-like chemotaxis protein